VGLHDAVAASDEERREDLSGSSYLNDLISPPKTSSIS
jgi:hypothetical protein